MLPGSQYEAMALQVLCDLVRIDTSNPPGNETACAHYLVEFFAQTPVETCIVESAPGRGNLVARLRGDGQGKPLMLMGHLDVVAAAAEEWRFPPFQPVLREGYVWGRGTTDMKNMVAACSVVLKALADRGVRPKCDVLLVFTADEEQGGQLGMGWLAREMPDLLDVACAINEGGGSPIKIGGRLFYTCQVAEKGLCRTVWTARAKGGHASTPRADMATLKLARAQSALGDGYLSERVTRTMRTALEAMALGQSPYAAERTRLFLDQGRVEDALLAAGWGDEEICAHRALFCDTVCVTGLRAGHPQQINVIPTTACAYADGRILPGQTRDGFMRALRERIGEEVELDVYEEQYSPGLEAPSDAPLFGIIQRVMAEHCDGAPVLPWLCAGSTDAKHLAPLGVPVYGFVPARPLPEGVEEGGAHSTDEHLWVENVSFAVQVLFDIIYRYCYL